MLVHWVSSLKLARHMFLRSDFFFANPEYIVAEYIEPFVFQSDKIANFQEIGENIIFMKPAVSNSGKYDRDGDYEIKCVLQCFFAPFTANLLEWLVFLQSFGNVDIYPDTGKFGWNVSQKCDCSILALRG